MNKTIDPLLLQKVEEYIANNEKAKLFLKKKGQIVSLTFKRPLETRAAFKGLNLEKRVKMTARAGVDYDNINDVQEKRESGELPAINAGLPWGEWFAFPHIIEHKGEKYFRFSTIPTTHNTKTEYFLNNEPVNFEDIKEKLLASEWKKDEDKDVFNLKEKYIEEIK